jgi:hypothetical protein
VKAAFDEVLDAPLLTDAAFPVSLRRGQIITAANTQMNLIVWAMPELSITNACCTLATGKFRTLATLAAWASGVDGKRGLIAGQRVGIKEVDDGIRIVSFMRYDLGYIDLEARTLDSALVAHSGSWPLFVRTDHLPVVDKLTDMR